VATYLYRLGALAARRRLTFLALSLTALTAVLVLAFGNAGSFQSSGSIPGSPAQVALDKADQHFPDDGRITGDLVFVAPDGAQLSDRGVARDLRGTLRQIRAVSGVTQVGAPDEQVSEDGRTAVVSVEFDTPEDGDVPAATLDAVRATGTQFTDDGGRAVFGGDAFAESVPLAGPGEAIGLGVALLILLITFGSIVAAGIPLLTAIFGVGGTIGVTLLAAHQFSISDNALTLSMMLGLAVGIDYALLILSRHRSQLARGMTVIESAALATASAGSAVVFAGLTVIIALCGLSVAGVPTLTSMGLVSAGAVAMAVFLALTLLPAVMGLAGERLRPSKDSRAGRRELDIAREGLAVRWVGAVTRHPKKVVAAVVLTLLVVAAPAMQLKLALTDNGSTAASSGSRQSYDLIAKAFGAGANGPLAVLVEGDSPQKIRSTAKTVAATVGRIPGVARVTDVEMAEDKQAAMVGIIPTTGPRDSATSALVGKLRTAVAPIGQPGASYVAVTGLTAVSIDVADKLTAALLPFTLVVVGLSVLLLMIAFRSWTIPLKATAGFLLSVGAAFGATVAVFQWGWLAGPLGVPSEGPVASFVPIIVMAVLFGLAMDYEVFLVSSMREHYSRHRQPRAAILAGSRNAGRVVVSAAAIMISVFVSFLFSHDPDIMPIAFALGFGVLVDAFVVRLTLVPAVLTLLGEHAWRLPRWLDRIVPNVDVEGHEVQDRRPELAGV
jgi:RND superfamily putative drug exporter